MTRRGMLSGLLGAVAVAVGLRYGLRVREAGADVAAGEGGDGKAAGEPAAAGEASAEGAAEHLELPKERWRELLGEREFSVLREEATERAGSSPLNGEHRAGTFICGGCFLPLFLSAQKFDSGTGWPSFFDVIKTRVGTRRDYKLLLPRTEYHCARCEGHQGHVFNDGPAPTGLRYCNNGLALLFVAEGEALPPLRQA